jgi:small-conductance mechanosensitive channel
MNTLIDFEFSEFTLLTVLILGILISLALKIIRRIFISKIIQNRIKQLYHLSEILIWVIFIFWGLHKVLKDSFYYMLAVLSIAAVIVIWVAWFVARDFIAGIVLKLGDNYQPGQQFKLDNIQGIIVESDYLHLTVRMQDGILVKIPYSKISGTVHYKNQIDNNSSQYSFEIEILKKYSTEIIHNQIRQAILLSAGASINKEPKISVKEFDGNTNKVEIVLYAMNPKYFQMIENNVRNAVAVDD